MTGLIAFITAIRLSALKYRSISGLLFIAPVDGFAGNQFKFLETIMNGGMGMARFLLLAMLITLSGDAVSQDPIRQDTPAEQNKTVIDMTEQELLKVYHKELSHVKFDAGREELSSLLEKAGERVTALFRDFSNTSAKEDVRMQSVLRGMLPRSAKREYNYLILPQSREGKVFFTEYRTDKENRAADQKLELGFAISSGYAGLCIYLHPTHQPYSRFRYLGRESRKPRAHVIAFAQKTESGEYMAHYYDVDTKTSVNFLVQGFVWLDPESYNILRMRTCMQVPYTSLKEQITDILYEKVEFENTQKQFWLPSEVNIRFELTDCTFRNQHKYSDYHLFSVESDMGTYAGKFVIIR